MIITIPDLHFKDDEPYFSASSLVAVELLAKIRSIVEPNTTIVSLGDVFHRAKETGRVNRLVTSLFSALAEIDGVSMIYVVRGNHDFSSEDGSALDCLKDLPKIQVIEEPTVLDLPEGKALCLPFIYPRTTLSSGVYVPSINSYYSNPANFPGTAFDYIFAHVADESTGTYARQCDLSWLSGAKDFGHIHKPVSPQYRGAIMPTRRDEASVISGIRVHRAGQSVQEVLLDPQFSIFGIRYGEEPCSLTPVSLVDIFGHDDKDIALREYREKYDFEVTGLFFDEVYGEEQRADKKELSESSGSDSPVKSVPEMLSEFIGEKKIGKKLEKVLKEAQSCA